MLIEANHFDINDFQSWVFYPGMLFSSPDKWWGDLGQRDFPHEGIDFCLYRDDSGRIVRLDHKTRLPAMHNGTVRSTFTDYLGQGVIVEHDDAPSQDGRLVSIYAHTRPLEHIRPGYRVTEGEIIATIADVSHSKATIYPHLHYTIGKPAAGIVYNGFVWNDMREPDWFALLNPLSIIDWPYRILAPKTKRKD